MTKYIVKLSEQDEMNLRQLVTQPGFDALIKLIQGESLSRQAEAMDCTDPSPEKRLTVLGDAQAMQRAVGSITRKLYGYREQQLLKPMPDAEDDPLQFLSFERTQ